jgi:hypothetical protein
MAAMASDPLSARNLAATFAVFGLGAMMLAPEPSWHSAGIGLACLAAFGGLSLFPSPRPGEGGTKDETPHRSARRTGAKSRARAAAAGAGPPPGMPEISSPRGLNDPHPALFKGLSNRRSGSAR